MQIKNILPLIGCFLVLALNAQDKKPLNFWKSSSDLVFKSALYERQIVPDKYQTFSFDERAMQKYLDQSLDKNKLNDQSEFIAFQIPKPDGEIEVYNIWRDNLLPKKLNDKFPEISVYAGYAVEDPSKTIRIDITSKGFRAVSYGHAGETFYIDPIAKGVTNTVMSYYKKDYTKKQNFQCLVEESIDEEDFHNHDLNRAAGDCQLHTFELALACTGEYASFHGGTANSVMAEFTTAINRINGLFETEIGVKLVFVPDTDDLIFFNANTDPYTCLLYTSPSPRDGLLSRMPSSA